MGTVSLQGLQYRALLGVYRVKVRKLMKINILKCPNEVKNQFLHVALFAAVILHRLESNCTKMLVQHIVNFSVVKVVRNKMFENFDH